jgi:hypothetical protein
MRGALVRGLKEKRPGKVPGQKPPKEDVQQTEEKKRLLHGKYSNRKFRANILFFVVFWQKTTFCFKNNQLCPEFCCIAGVP